MQSSSGSLPFLFLIDTHLDLYLWPNLWLAEELQPDMGLQSCQEITMAQTPGDGIIFGLWLISLIRGNKMMVKVKFFKIFSHLTFHISFINSFISFQQELLSRTSLKYIALNLNEIFINIQEKYLTWSARFNYFGIKFWKGGDLMNWQIYSIICLENAIICLGQMAGQLILCKTDGDERPLRDAIILYWAPYATQNWLCNRNGRWASEKSASWCNCPFTVAQVWYKATTTISMG